ncbi:hypothetical protein VNI00_007683 [Paramarasmius palmivorus]|uniref:Uncharacterized protein n=1 Tax=Paramarasmius palmivorus TaxID=297713 RepID=A0AAW0D3C6_9AGAR
MVENTSELEEGELEPQADTPPVQIKISSNHSEDIEAKLANTLAKLLSQTDSTCQAETRSLQLVFEDWRKALDAGPRTVAPQVFACLLEEGYENHDNEVFMASLLRGNDRCLLSYLAPVTEACAFDLHFGMAEYYQRGYVDIPPPPEMSIDAEEDEDEDEEMAEDSRNDGEDKGETYSENSFVASDIIEPFDAIEIGYRFSNVTTLEGIPMVLTGLDLKKTTKHLCRLLDANRITAERKPVFKVGPLEDTEMMRDATATWASKCLLITPSKSANVVFRVSDELEDFACKFFSPSTCKVASEEYEGVVTMILEWLRGRSDPIQPGTRRVATYMCRSAVQQKNIGLFKRLLEACGSHRIVALLDIEELLAAFKIFEWGDIENQFTQAVTNDPSKSRRARLICDVADAAFKANNTKAVSWCKSQNESLIESLGTGVGINDIEFLVQSLQLCDDPIETIVEKFLPKLYESQLANSKLWTALFTRLRSTPSFDKSLALSTVISDSIRHIASKLNHFQSSQLNWRNHYSVEHIRDMVDLSVQFDTHDAVVVLLQRLWDQSQKQDPAKTAQCYGDLMWTLGEVITAHSQLQNNLRPFFGHAFWALLYNNPQSSGCNSQLKNALKHQRDPVAWVIQCLTSDDGKGLPKLDPGFCDSRLGNMFRFVNDLRSKATSSSNKDQLQEALDLALTQRLTNLNLAPLSEEKYAAPPPPGTEYEILQCIDLCLILNRPDEISRILDQCLSAPQCNERHYTQHGLVTLAIRLPEVLSKHRLSLSSGDIGPLAHFVGEVTKRYLNHCIGKCPVPGAHLQPVSCGCYDCKQSLAPIFESGRRPGGSQSSKVEVRAKQKLRKHFQERLEHTRTWGVKWGPSGKKNMMQIDIPNTLNDLLGWFAKVEIARKMLASLGGTDRQRRVLGADYDQVSSCMASDLPKRPLDDGAAGGPSKKARIC